MFGNCAAISATSVGNNMLMTWDDKYANLKSWAIKADRFKEYFYRHYETMDNPIATIKQGSTNYFGFNINVPAQNNITHSRIK